MAKVQEALSRAQEDIKNALSDFSQSTEVASADRKTMHDYIYHFVGLSPKTQDWSNSETEPSTPMETMKARQHTSDPPVEGTNPPESTDEEDDTTWMTPMPYKNICHPMGACSVPDPKVSGKGAAMGYSRA